MASKSTRAKTRSAPEIVLRNGQPAAVILDIEHYRELAERAKDAEDLKMLEGMGRKPLRFRTLDESPAAEETAYDPNERPIEEVLAELAAEVPAEEWNRLPVDLSDQLDHYLYGHPKQ